MGPLMDDKAYDVTLESGERMLSFVLNSPLAYDFFYDQNAAAPPGTPKMLLDYFQSVQRESDQELAEEGRRAFERDTGRRLRS